MGAVEIRAALLVIVGSAAGCSPHVLAPLLAQAASPQDATQVAAVPTGEGAKYVSVITEGNVPATAVRNRWRREALKTCDGDYVLLSENAAVRSSGGRTAGRMHEGFIRCVSPEATLAEEDKPASDQGRSDSSRRPLTK
ncbi:MAG TPA: hypothetical protein VG755_31335 [Nannocystaceae bacterium]|nr:hypothetical protein [Nannocystaceae bacterium]